MPKKYKIKKTTTNKTTNEKTTNEKTTNEKKQIVIEGMTETMITKLNNLGLNGTEICRLLQKSCAIMTGSFPLQVLTGMDFLDSDIDFFSYSSTDYNWELTLDSNKKHRFTSKMEMYFALLSEGKTNFNGSKTNYIGKVYKTKGETDGKCKKNIIGKINNVISYDINGKKIQFITLDGLPNVSEKAEKKDQLLTYIQKAFDLKCCQVVFDGEKIIVLGDGNDLQNIYKKITSITSIDNSEFINNKNVLKRIKKYEARGFTVTNKNLFIEKQKQKTNTVIPTKLIPKKPAPLDMSSIAIAQPIKTPDSVPIIYKFEKSSDYNYEEPVQKTQENEELEKIIVTKNI